MDHLSLLLLIFAYSQLRNVYVKLLEWSGQEIDMLFTRLTGAFEEATLEDFLSCIIREREELSGKQPRHVRLFYRNAIVPPTQKDILTSIIASNPHIEQANFFTLRDFLGGQTLLNHYFVAQVRFLDVGSSLSTRADAAPGVWLW